MLFYALILYGVSCDRPRGVSISRSSFYVNKDGHFSCLDGKGRIPFDQVNDDFCDCDDGSDEPGTAACPNGKFHCTNAGFKPMNILSSRVNDMICDCCDGSDEWAGHVSCPNTCKEAYAKEYAAKISANAVQAQGWEKRKAMISEAAGERQRNSEELSDVENRLNTIQVEKDAVEKLRNSAEDAEKAAKDVIEAKKTAKVLELAATYDEETLAKIAFDHLDSNNNGEIVQYEISSQKYLDPTPDSSFNSAETKEMMKQKDKLMLEDFVADLWPEIKDKLIPKLDGAMAKYENDKFQAARDAEREAQRIQEEANMAEDSNEDDMFLEEDREEPGAAEPEPPTEEDIQNDLDADIPDEEAEPEVDELDELQSDEYDADDDYYDEDDYPEDYDEDEYDSMREDHVDSNNDEDVDEETQAIFNAATEARKQFNEIDDKFKDIERRIKEIEELTDKDFGGDDVFLPMYKKCYELRTAEYIYTLCPYDKCSQRPINGGSETKLGNWKGFNEDYSEMIFDGGIRCWNGPDRSAIIKLSCGADHKVLSVTEPNRCEYEYKFETPAVCAEPEHMAPPSDHDEL